MSIGTQPFGRTSHTSTRAIFGAASLSHVTQEEADRTLEVLLRFGVNHIDVAASYGDAELRIAPWLARYRSQFYFLNTVGDIHLLPKVLDAASRFQPGVPPPTGEQMQALVARLGMIPIFV